MYRPGTSIPENFLLVRSDQNRLAHSRRAGE
jgi:hypothetical protein